MTLKEIIISNYDMDHYYGHKWKIYITETIQK